MTVFGSASKSAAADLPSGLSRAEAARHVFVTAADKSFWTATAFLAATWLLVAFAIRPGRSAAAQKRLVDAPAAAAAD